MITKADAIDLLIDIGVQAKHRHECIPIGTVKRIIRHEDDKEKWGAALITFTQAVMNWGVKGLPIQICDPAQRSWKGNPARSGKHLFDGSAYAPWGGLGGPHFDGRGEDDDDLRDGMLERIYDVWGFPPGFPREGVEWDFNKILASDYREEWLAWSTKLVQIKDFHAWCFSTWIKRYWTPNWEPYKDLTHGEMESVMSAAMLARIANSAKGKAKQWVGLRHTHLERRYVDYKKQKRGEKGAKRAERQIRYTRRVGKLYKYVFSLIQPI